MSPTLPTPAGDAPAARLGLAPGVETVTSPVHVGDRVAAILSADLPPGCAAGAPREAEPSPEWAVLPRSDAARDAVVAEAPGTTHVPLWVIPFRTGEQEFPGAILPWSCPDGRGEEARSGPLRLHVQPLVENAATATPADIRGPAELRPGPPHLLLAALVAALVAAGLVALWWSRRRSRPALGAPSSSLPFDGLTPAEWALRALDRLLAEGLLERGDPGVFHERLSDIVRCYLEGRFAVVARERTTSEILLAVEERAAPLPGTGQALRRVLGDCDLVKFARARPGSEESRASAAHARRFVTETRPAAPVEEGAR